MDKLYVPQNEALEQAIKSLQESEKSGEYSDRLQMLTALLAVALFMLGITSVIRHEKLKLTKILANSYPLVRYKVPSSTTYK